MRRDSSLEASSTCLSLEPLRFEWEIMYERVGIYRQVSNWVLTKNMGFSTKKVEESYLTRSLHAWGSWLGHAPWAHQCYFLHVIVCFFVFLGVSFHIRSLRTRKQNSSLCNVLCGLLNFHSWSSQDLHKSSNVLLYRSAWFLLELHQNSLELLCFGKKIELHNLSRKHYKCLENRKQLFQYKTPLFEIKTK